MRLLSLEVKMKEEDKPSYEHLVTILMYRKEMFEMDEVSATLISSEIMKTKSENLNMTVLILHQVQNEVGGDRGSEDHLIGATLNKIRGVW